MQTQVEPTQNVAVPTTPQATRLTSQSIRSKFQPSDIQLATARAEKFLASLGQSDRFTTEVTTLLADYDLNQLDEMFGEASSAFVSEP